ncbi:hypothetical protein WJX73_002485 [Symbiochloris irregularis]|uniref:HNH nuclease domain-containing protein n=1 Tax=Symbiochloris irregularis TaxID=706552 RepID=A0AAW1P2Q5_9CHLO
MRIQSWQVDCDSEKPVQESSLSAIQATFPGFDCYVWHKDCWDHIDASTAGLVVDGSCLRIIRKPIPVQPAPVSEERLLQIVRQYAVPAEQLEQILSNKLGPVTRMLIHAQLQPAASSRSAKRDDAYRRTAIKFYFGEDALSAASLCCMVTGECVPQQGLTAGHIYRRAWPTGILASMELHHDDPRNIIIMQKSLKHALDQHKWALFPQEDGTIQIHVLYDRFLNSRTEQYITGNKGASMKWSDIHLKPLVLPSERHGSPAKRLCGIQASTAIDTARASGWISADAYEQIRAREAAWAQDFDRPQMESSSKDQARLTESLSASVDSSPANS